MHLRLKIKSINLHKINICWFVVFFLNIDMLEDFIKDIYILVLKKEPFDFLNTFLMLIGALVVVYLLLKKHFDLSFLLLTFIYVLVYVLSTLLTPDIVTILPTSINRGILYVLMIVYLMSLIDDYGELLQFYIPYIYITAIYALIQMINRRNPLISETYYMEVTYNTMMPMLAALAIGIYGNKVTEMINRYIALVLFAIMFAVNLLVGGRASILCVGLCLIVLIHFKNIRQKIGFMILIIGLGGVMYITYDVWLAFLTIAFPYSRTIWRLSNNFFFESNTSYRSIMWKHIIDNFLENPFRIRGFLSDRFYLMRLFPTASSEGAYGYYAHNLFLEQLFQFGVLAIPVIIVEIISVIRLFRFVSGAKNNRLVCVFSIYIAFGVGQLMVSASYLTAKSFGILLGLMLYMGKPQRRKYENITYL